MDLPPAPLSVTALGRSGSTWLMHLIGMHDDVSVASSYPYEAIFGREAVAKFKLDQDVRALHQRIVEAYGESARFFAEKNLLDLPTARAVWRDSAEVFLIRDFRDVIASSLAFNRKRGFEAFGREAVTTDLAYVYHRAEQARGWILEPWRRRGAEAVLVKYEELIAEPVATLRTIFGHLGLSTRDDQIEELLIRADERSLALEYHRTSRTHVSSVGRWQDDLSDEVISACHSAFGEMLETFNYDISTN